MAKINNTYDAGYYIPDDYDYRKLPKDDEAQRRERQRQEQRDKQRAKKHASRAGAAGPDEADPRHDPGGAGPAAAAEDEDNVIHTSRRTYMLEFPTICNGCEQVIGRGTKVYAQVSKLREKYLNAINYFDLKFKCPKCGLNDIVHRSDPATNSYIIRSGARAATSGGRQLEDVITANDAAGAAQDDEPNAEDEMTAKIERHQKAAMDAEAVDDAIAAELKQMLFPAADVLRAVKQAHAEQRRVAQELQAEAAKGPQLSEEDRATTRMEFERLRAEKGIRSAPTLPAVASSAAGADPFAALELGDGLEDAHADAIDRALKAMPRTNSVDVAAPAPSAPAPSTDATNAAGGKSKLLGQLFA
jgi:hypothetical protein